VTRGWQLYDTAGPERTFPALEGLIGSGPPWEQFPEAMMQCPITCPLSTPGDERLHPYDGRVPRPDAQELPIVAVRGRLRLGSAEGVSTQITATTES